MAFYVENGGGRAAQRRMARLTGKDERGNERLALQLLRNRGSKANT